jgi:hypothetical protein
MVLDEIFDLNDLKLRRLGQETAWPPFGADLLNAALSKLAEFCHANAGDRYRDHGSPLNL